MTSTAPQTTTPQSSHAGSSRAVNATGAPTSQPAADRRWWTLAVLCLSLLMTVLDTTVVNVALPTLDRTLRASSSGLEWIVDAYTLVFAGLLLLGGALGDRYGRHRALPAGLLVFAAGSVFAALSGSVDQLTAARAIMGAGAALVMPATLSILTGVFPDSRERAKAIAIWSAVSGLGVAIGPTLGGVLLEHFSWTSIFLINLPVVAVALIGGRKLVPASRAPRPPRIDVPGAILSVVGLSALTYTLIQAPGRGWTSASTLTTGAIAAVLLGGFALLQLRSAEPMVDLRLFGNPRFAGASGSVTALFFALSATTFLLTQIYQFVLGYTPLQAGLRTLPPALMVAIFAPVGEKIAAKAGARAPITAGLAVATAGMALFATASTSSGYVHYMLAMTIICVGIGLTMAPATHTIMSSVPPAKAGVGSAVNDTTRNLGSVLGIAVIGSIVATTYKTTLAPISSHLGRHLAGLVGQSVGLATQIGHQLPGSAGHVVTSAAHHAFINAADQGLLIAGAVTLGAVILAVRTLPGREPTRAQASTQTQATPANA